MIPPLCSIGTQKVCVICSTPSSRTPLLRNGVERSSGIGVDLYTRNKTAYEYLINLHHNFFQVAERDIKAFVRKNKAIVKYVETSAKDNPEDIAQVFEFAVKAIVYDETDNSDVGCWDAMVMHFHS